MSKQERMIEVICKIVNSGKNKDDTWNVYEVTRIKKNKKECWMKWHPIRNKKE